MNGTSTPTGLPELISEHENLVLRLKAERMWWQQLREMGKPNFGQMGTRLEELRKRLAEHFAHEESIEQSADESNRQLALSLESKEQHHTFLDRLDGIIMRLCGCKPGFDCWGEAGQEFETFAMDLQLEQEAELRRLRSLLDKPH